MKAINFLNCLIVGSNKQGRDEKVEKLIGIDIENSANNPDFFKLSSETSIGIDEIRKIRQFLSLKPFVNEKKIVFIQEAQNLTTEAQNALLKTLEEPPASSVIILTVPNTSLLLPTVLSRMNIINLKFEENVKLTKDEQDEKIKFLQTLINSSVPKRLILLEETQITKDRQTVETWLDEMTFSIRQTMLSGNTFDLKTCTIFLKKIQKTKMFLNANCNTKLSLENLMIDL